MNPLRKRKLFNSECTLGVKTVVLCLGQEVYLHFLCIISSIKSLVLELKSTMNRSKVIVDTNISKNNITPQHSDTIYLTFQHACTKLAQWKRKLAKIRLFDKRYIVHREWNNKKLLSKLWSDNWKVSYLVALHCKRSSLVPVCRAWSSPREAARQER